MKILFIQVLVFLISSLQTVPPVVLFHGLGDQCSNSGFASLTRSIAKGLNTYAVCIEIGNGAITSFIGDFQKQAQQACEKLKLDPKLTGDIQVVGLSQGALLGRYILESCDFNGSVVRYLSIGGPQMGVSKFPGCFEGAFCGVINWVVDKLVYSSVVQRHAGPAGYFHDPANTKSYLKSSVFLPELNNEVSRNESKYHRVLKTDMMLVMFLKDSMIHPKETAWFQFVDEHHRLVSFFDSDIYRNDLLPLKTLYTNGKLKFVQIDGDHLRFSEKDLQETFIPFLKAESNASFQSSDKHHLLPALSHVSVERSE